MDENDDGEDEQEDVEFEEYQDGEIIEEEKEDSEEDQTSPLVQKSSNGSSNHCLTEQDVRNEEADALLPQFAPNNVQSP